MKRKIAKNLIFSSRLLFFGLGIKKWANKWPSHTIYENNFQFSGYKNHLKLFHFATSQPNMNWLTGWLTEWMRQKQKKTGWIEMWMTCLRHMLSHLIGTNSKRWRRYITRHLVSFRLHTATLMNYEHSWIHVEPVKSTIKIIC